MVRVQRCIPRARRVAYLGPPTMADSDRTDPEHQSAPPDGTPAPATSLSESVGLLTLSNGISFAAGIVRQKVFAVFLGPAGVGALSLATAFFDLLATAVRMGVPTGLLGEVSRRLADGQQGHAARAYRDSAARLLVVALGVSVAAGLGVTALDAWVFQGALPMWTAPLLALAVPCLLLAQLRESLLSAHQRIRRLALSKVIVTVGTLVVTVLLVANWGLAGGIVQIAAGAVIALGVTGVALAPVFKARDHDPSGVADSEAREARSRIVRIGAAEALYHIGVTLNLLVFRGLIVSALGLDANGLYQVVLGLSRQYVPAVLGGVFVALYPRLSAQAGRGEEFAASRASGIRYVFVLAVPLALILLASREWLIALVFTSEFAAAERLFRWTAPGDVLLFLSGVLQIGLLATGAARRFVLVGLASELIYFACFIVGVDRFGLDGAAAAYFVAAVASVWLFARAQGLGVLALARDIRPLRAALGVIVVGGSALLALNGLPERAAVLLVALVWLWVHRAILIRPEGT